MRPLGNGLNAELFDDSDPYPGILFEKVDCSNIVQELVLRPFRLTKQKMRGFVLESGGEAALCHNDFIPTNVACAGETARFDKMDEERVSIAGDTRGR
jgi:hypothetical protein